MAHKAMEPDPVSQAAQPKLINKGHIRGPIHLHRHRGRRLQRPSRGHAQRGLRGRRVVVQRHGRRRRHSRRSCSGCGRRLRRGRHRACWRRQRGRCGLGPRGRRRHRSRRRHGRGRRRAGAQLQGLGAPRLGHTPCTTPTRLRTATSPGLVACTLTTTPSTTPLTQVRVPQHSPWQWMHTASWHGLQSELRWQRYRRHHPLCAYCMPMLHPRGAGPHTRRGPATSSTRTNAAAAGSVRGIVCSGTRCLRARRGSTAPAWPTGSRCGCNK